MIYINKKGLETEFDVNNFPFSSNIKHEIKSLDYGMLTEFEDWCIDIVGDDEIYDISTINEILESRLDEFEPISDFNEEEDY